MKLGFVRQAALGLVTAAMAAAWAAPAQAAIRIGAETGGMNADGSFTFKLEEVTKYLHDPGDDNYETKPAAGVAYTVHNVADKSLASGGGQQATGSDGGFTLKAGQYAEFDVDAKKSWIATSLGSPASWYLNGLAAKGAAAKMEKRGSSSMLFYPENIKEKQASVKYAVAIYGIEQDEYENGNGDKAGLTFGPATGANYTNKYKACEGTSADEPGNCIHWMTWEQIIAQSQKDPNVFQNCLKNGCTHSVELDLKGMKIAAGGYAAGTTTWTKSGDGASVLYDSIASSYRKWNNSGYNYGGWPASRIRAVLNGSDQYTADGQDVKIPAGGWDYLTETQKFNFAGDMQNFTADDALISAFPQELQANIVPKAVKTDTKYNDESSYNVTTYDKLWLFSGKEIYQDPGSNNAVIRDNEGTLYARASELGITTKNYGGNKAYDEDGSADWWWLRSPDRSDDDGVYDVRGGGGWSNDYADDAGSGVAPVFCIK